VDTVSDTSKKTGVLKNLIFFLLFLTVPTASELVVTLSSSAAPAAWTQLTHVMASVSSATSGCGAATSVKGRVASVSLSGPTATFTLAEEADFRAFFADLDITFFSGDDTKDILSDKIIDTDPEAGRIVEDLSNHHQRRRMAQLSDKNRRSLLQGGWKGRFPPPNLLHIKPLPHYCTHCSALAVPFPVRSSIHPSPCLDPALLHRRAPRGRS
jgi:hypothetical protein